MLFALFSCIMWIVSQLCAHILRIKTSNTYSSNEESEKVLYKRGASVELWRTRTFGM